MGEEKCLPHYQEEGLPNALDCYHKAQDYNDYFLKNCMIHSDIEVFRYLYCSSLRSISDFFPSLNKSCRRNY